MNLRSAKAPQELQAGDDKRPFLGQPLRLNNGPLVGVILSEITLRLTARSSFTFNKRLEQRNDRVFKRAVL